MSDSTQFSKARLETLCDGIFAIAMTLLTGQFWVLHHISFHDVATRSNASAA